MSTAGQIAKLIITGVLFYSSLTCAHDDKREYVVIMHGIARTSAHMQPLAEYLEREGYEVLNLSYPSTKYNIEQLIRIVSKDVDSLITDRTRTVNFVGYSMGGLIVRGVIAKNRPDHLGRVVLIAPPNHGSEVADFHKNNIIYKKVYGPAGQELTTDNMEIADQLGPVDYDLGIIAGNFTIDPISSLIISGDDDGKVSIESTKLDGMKDHVVISASHTFFPSNKVAQEQVLTFLRTGSFTDQGLPAVK